MKFRKNVLWKVPVFCLVAGLIGYFVTFVLFRPIIAPTTVKPDGTPVTTVSQLPISIVGGCLFVAVFLLGALWALRGMTKLEIVISAAITCGIYLVLTLANLYITGFPFFLGYQILMFKEWFAGLAYFLWELVPGLHGTPASLLACAVPLLFIPFGNKAACPKEI